MKKYLSNAELQKIRNFTFYYMDSEEIHISCSILKAMEYYRKSPSADLFVSHCNNCNIYIDGWNRTSAAYLGFTKDIEFIIAIDDNMVFDDGTPEMGLEIYNKLLRLSPTFEIK